MSADVVTSQAELAIALRDGAPDIVIDSPADEWLTVWQNTVPTGGPVVIDMTAGRWLDPEAWCEWHGVRVVDGIASLYKAVDDDFMAGHEYTRTAYRPGSVVTAADWVDDNRCGGGLHLGPTSTHATAYDLVAARWVRVEVPVAEIRPILGGSAKCKVQSCRVVAEVDRWGGEVAS